MSRDKCLAQTDPAITGRHVRLEVDFKRFRMQCGQERLQQQNILKAAATEADAIQVALLAKLFGNLDEYRH